MSDQKIAPTQKTMTSQDAQLAWEERRHMAAGVPSQSQVNRLKHDDSEWWMLSIIVGFMIGFFAGLGYFFYAIHLPVGQ